MGWCGAVSLPAQTVTFFDDSDDAGYYDSGLAFKTPPSNIQQAGPSGDKIPLATGVPPFDGDNSLQLRWTSRADGDWAAFVIAPGFPFQDITATDTLSFWAYSVNGIMAENLPLIYMEGAPGTTKSNRYPLGDYVDGLPAEAWTQVKVPLNVFFEDPNQNNIDFTRTKAVIFGQDRADNTEHTLLVDEVKAFACDGSTEPPLPPENVRAEGYDSHVELRWSPSPSAEADRVRIYRSADGGQTFEPVKTVSATDTLYLDFVRDLGANLNLQYRLTALRPNGAESEFSSTLSAQTFEMTDAELMNMVQEYTFRYFWDFAHPVSGLTRERSNGRNEDLVTMGGSGFGIMAILVGIERAFITYAEGLDRITTIVDFLAEADRFRGVFPHWMNGATGEVIPFSSQDNGGDIVETAFLFEGLLTARQYFDGGSAAETALRQQITQLYEAIDWNFYRNNRDVILWHWSPAFNFAINLPVRGWNETMIVYILAIASPTKGVPASLYDSGWAGGNYVNGNEYFDIELPLGRPRGGPLFFAHYSFLGFDPRDKRDDYANYFRQNRNHSLINQAYCIDNPKAYIGYGEDCWGLTASDDPVVGYRVHEPTIQGDNGTLTPTAALSSMPYTPEASMKALKHFYRVRGAELFGPMGFYDAFNPTLNWVADSYLAIDQGPIIGMIENHRSGLLWEHFMANEEIQDALNAIGFTPDSTTTAVRDLSINIATRLFPNPSGQELRLDLQLEKPRRLTIELLDRQGRRLQRLQEMQPYPAGEHQLQFRLDHQPAGLYFLRIGSPDGQRTLKLLLHND